MHCTNCGSVMPDGSRFCTNCGASLPTEQASAGGRRKKEKPKRRLLIVILAAVAVVLAGLVVGTVHLFGGGRTGSRDGSRLIPTMMDDGSLWFITMRGDVIECKEPKSFHLATGVSLSGETGYVITDDDELYVCTAKGKTRVAKDVGTATVSCDGRYVAYTVEDGEDCTLYAYHVAKDVSEELDDIRDGYIEYLALSPDGRSALYTVHGSEDELYLSVNGKEPESLGENRYPIGLSDGAKVAFYFEHDGESTLYVQKGVKATRLGTGTLSNASMNRACTELLYCIDDESYLSRNGEKGVKVSDDSGAFACLLQDARWVSLPWYDGIELWMYIDSIPTYTGRPCVAYADDNSCLLTYVGKGADSRVLAKDVSDTAYAFSDDGRRLAYIKDGEVFYLANTTAGKRAEQLFDDEPFVRLDASADLKSLYLLTEDSELFYATPGGELTSVCDDVTSFVVDPYTGACYVLTKDGKLYRLHKDAKRERVDAEGEVAQISYFDGTMCYRVDDSSASDWYRIHDDLSSELLARDVDLLLYYG